MLFAFLSKDMQDLHYWPLWYVIAEYINSARYDDNPMIFTICIPHSSCLAMSKCICWDVWVNFMPCRWWYCALRGNDNIYDGDFFPIHSVRIDRYMHLCSKGEDNDVLSNWMCYAWKPDKQKFFSHTHSIVRSRIWSEISVQILHRFKTGVSFSRGQAQNRRVHDDCKLWANSTIQPQHLQ